MVGYYDFILGLIPLALLGVSGLLQVGGFATTAAVNVGGLVAVVLVGHALFVNGPVDVGGAGGAGRDGPDADA